MSSNVVLIKTTISEGFVLSQVSTEETEKEKNDFYIQLIKPIEVFLVPKSLLMEGGVSPEQALQDDVKAQKEGEKDECVVIARPFAPPKSIAPFVKSLSLSVFHIIYRVDVPALEPLYNYYISMAQRIYSDLTVPTFSLGKKEGLKGFKF